MNRTCPRRVPKLIGADIEFGNSIEGWPGRSPGNATAASLLLGAIGGVPHFRPLNYQSRLDFEQHGSSGIGDSDCFNDWQQSLDDCQDWGRKFLETNGGSAYIDLQHLEMPLPEVLSAFDFNAAWHAALRTVCEASRIVNRRLGRGRKVRVVANNSDGFSHSYGSHLNILMDRRSFNNLFHHKLHHLMFLASHQVSSIVFAGQGKVGSENGRSQVDYQISQRADFFESLSGWQTTHQRPIVNSRNEPLCGESNADPAMRMNDRYARLHAIFYDSNLAHVATILKVGALQMIVALCEADSIDPNCLLDDPVATVHRWSHDPQLQLTAQLANGKSVTAVDLQRRILEHAARHEAKIGFDGVVPGARGLIELWSDVLEKLAKSDFQSLLGSIDWILKKHLLDQFLERHTELTYVSPEIKHLDWMYSNVDPDCGLYWACERQGLIDCITTDAEIAHFMFNPPTDTRAWCRSKLLNIAGDRISSMDWDRIEFSLDDRIGWPVRRTLMMSDPLGMTQQEVGHLFTPGKPLMELLDDLDEHNHRSETNQLPTFSDK